MIVHSYLPIEPPTSMQNSRKGIHNGSPSGCFILCAKYKGLQDIIRNINILGDVAELISHIVLVDGDVLVFEVRRIEGEVFQDALQDRIEAAGADVFGLCIHAGGDVGDGGEGVFGEGDVDAFGLEERGVLADEGLPRFGQDAAEVILGEA